ncbi:hypothetical protein Q8A67_003884 [Cirrhinus molitorella]|uniref:Uncharacterized protein n=1 Tax=Cirrhinus molitorella TaxID=172907 RepID=A0AA88QG01_9TELE|nr:hypothetical protein Q8A67_003884 [Cirrhinus molitorella]
MLGQAVRRFATSAVRSSHYAEGPGKNLPFSASDPEEMKLLPVTHCECDSCATQLSVSSGVDPVMLFGGSRLPQVSLPHRKPLTKNSKTFSVTDSFVTQAVHR